MWVVHERESCHKVSETKSVPQSARYAGPKVHECACVQLTEKLLMET